MRILIKLSGEALSGSGQGTFPYDREVVEGIALAVSRLRAAGNEIALVVGGGNLFRGQELKEHMGIERSTADYIGMLSTVENALVLRDLFELHGMETRVSSSIAMTQICESYMPRRARRHLEKGRVVIFAGGLGAPYFTTDTTAVQRALEMRVDMLVMTKNGVPGVMSADPDIDPRAVLIPEISCSEVLAKDLKVADQSAIALAKEHGLTLRVVGVDRIVDSMDPSIGSTIVPK